MATVLLVESSRANGSSFGHHLKKRYTLLVATTGKEAVTLAKAQPPDVMVVDSTLMRTSGDRICTLLRNEFQVVPIIHIKENQQEDAPESAADMLMHPPFTYRKLCNRIDRYTAAAHADDILEAGKFKLNLTQAILSSPQGEQKLTPKLSQLLAVLMQQAGQVVARRQLIKEVWQTDYMGDTRTLDVHMRWLRQAIEANPSQPQYVKTVRGKGYILYPPD